MKNEIKKENIEIGAKSLLKELKSEYNALKILALIKKLYLKTNSFKGYKRINKEISLNNRENLLRDNKTKLGESLRILAGVYYFLLDNKPLNLNRIYSLTQKFIKLKPYLIKKFNIDINKEFALIDIRKIDISEFKEDFKAEVKNSALKNEVKK